VTIEYFIDTCSSWVYLARETITRLRVAFGDRAEFTWRIALLDRSEALGYTPDSMDWYYRRSHALAGEKLDPHWIVNRETGSLEANLVVEAARELGIHDDRAWLAIARETMGNGQPIASFVGAADTVAATCGIDADRLVDAAQSAVVRDRIEASTKRFHELALPQRPAFVLRSAIDDEARFCGLIDYDPMALTIEAMLRDEERSAAYTRTHGIGP
jgi:predicted DsbA family dithiol-disulfide isomerase